VEGLGRNIVCALVGCILSALSLTAQTPLPQFDVATVRQSPPPPGNLININIGTLRNGKVTFENASLSDCLKFAYGLVSDDQLAGPDWIKSNAARFDIVAQAPAETTREQITLMMRELLRERLGVETHHEQKVLPHLVLTVAKNGPRLSEPAAGNNSASAGRIDGNHMSMQGLSMLLSRFERQTVIDMTGLQGDFRLHLEWAPSSTNAAADAPAGPSVFSALQEQLGLKLESRKDPIDVLVVDHADQKPTDN